MATATLTCPVAQIGEIAGMVWHALDEQGPLSLAKLSKATDAHRDTVLMAVGWLAREEKIEIEETSRGRLISLRDAD